MAAVFGPAVGHLDLPVHDAPQNHLGSAFDGGMYALVAKDLRRVLGRPVDGPFSRGYYGAGDLAACRAALWQSLSDAAGALQGEFGSAAAGDWRRAVADDRIEISALGLVSLPPIPWQNRPTFHQVVQVGAPEERSGGARPATPLRGRTLWSMGERRDGSSGWRRVLAVATAALAAAGGAALPVVTAAEASATETPPAPVLLGVYYGNQGWAMKDVRAMEAWQQKRHAVVELFTSWNGNRKTVDNLFGQQLPNVWSSGNVPLVTWEPFTGGTTPADVEVRIARGDYDGYVRTWASRLAGFLAGGDGRLGTADDRRAYLRLAHEANGDWYPWGAASGGNSPADYVAMWRRVHGLVAATGVGPSQLQWVWAVNSDDVGGHPAEAFWPGDAYADWVAVDGYNWGASQSWSTWRSPEATLGAMVARLRALAPGKPLAVTETASTSSTAAGPSLAAKRAWVAELYAWLPANGVRMIVWFDEDKETDWAVFGGSGGDETFRSGRTSYRALAAYRTAVASAAYVGSDPADPRLLNDDRFAGR